MALKTLERVPQRELHYASGFGFIQRRLSGGEFSEVVSGVPAEERISSQTQVSDRRSIKPLSVGYVKDFPTELQRVSFPGHLERLVQAHVERNVSRTTKHVSVAHF